MDISYGDTYNEFRAQVRDFIARNKQHAPKVISVRDPDMLVWQKLLIENGYAARTIPKTYGGYGASPDILEAQIISEEFAAADLYPGLSGQGITMLTPLLLQMGSEEQQQLFIKPTICGEMIWCQGYSEPGAGSDLASLSSKAHLDGEHWVVNGQKIWTSTAQEADWIFCLVRTEPDAPKRHGISFLLFRMDSPGIEVRPLVDMTGKANFNEVFFTDVRVPKDQIVGERGQGWQVANTLLGFERGSLAPANTALARLNALIKMMQQETINGHPVMENPVMRDRLMKLQGRVMAMRFNDMRLLSARINPGQDVGLAALIVKLQGTELRHELEGFAIDVMGELGLAWEDNPYLRDPSWQYHYMYYLGLIIGGGTSQIQKNIISERGLDMPREPLIDAKA